MIDLHTHTTVSDGGDTPSELVSKAAGAGVATLAVTDHDNDTGCDEAVARGNEVGVEVIRGVEISCDVESELLARGYRPATRPTMHLLGYFVPEGKNLLSEGLADLRYHRANRNRMIVDRLNEFGIPVTFAEVEAEAGGPGAQIGRPHFAAVLVRHGAVKDYQQAFDEYLAKDAKAYIDRRLYKAEDAIELMLEAEVVPVLAHPFTLNLPNEQLASFIDDLQEAGLRGVEGYHGDHTVDEQEPIRALARERGLIVTGGSDHHGAMRPDRGLPGGRHGVMVPPEVLEDLRSVHQEIAG